jgi:hypothetical protein
MKKNEQPAVIASKLIIEKDEFEKQLKDRILKGKELLDFPVKILSKYIDTRGKEACKYDETEQLDFLSEYKKGKKIQYCADSIFH